MDPTLPLPDAVSAPPPRIPIALMAGLSLDPADANSEMDEDALMSTFCSALQTAISITWQRLKEATIELIEEGFTRQQPNSFTSIVSTSTRWTE